MGLLVFEKIGFLVGGLRILEAKGSHGGGGVPILLTVKVLENRLKITLSSLVKGKHTKLCNDLVLNKPKHDNVHLRP